MTKMTWDAVHLREWERNRRQRELEPQIETDWQTAIHSTQRMRSEAERGPTRCPNRQCRRQRRCVPTVPVCVPLLWLKLPPGLEQKITEDHYTELQLLRRAMAQDRSQPR